MLLTFEVENVFYFCISTIQLLMIKKTFILFGFLFALSSAYSQECGVTNADQANWFSKYKEHLSEDSYGDVTLDEYQIPIVLHLVARDNGVGRAKISTALAMLCELNALYAGTGISFYLANGGINLIDHDGIFNDNNLAIHQLAMENERQDSALNVFVVNSVGANNVVGFYDSNRDWVVIQKSVFVQENKTLAHEIGHLFSLLHPHFGWDGVAWNMSIHGNPTQEIASDGITLTEKMDGSNCEIAGDLLCDTPPDYNFGINWSQSCNYQGGAKDPNNVLVDPDESLIMSYFNDDCRSSFTAAQIGVLLLDIEHPTREYLRPEYEPSSDSILNPAQLNFPNTLLTITNEIIDFDWEVVPNAQYYYIEYDRSPDFDLDPKGMITEQNSISISHAWIAGLDYYWRVFAWNESYFCNTASNVQQFKVDVMSSSTSVNANNTIYLIPLVDNIRLDYQVGNSEEISFSIYSIDGKKVFSNFLHLHSGSGILDVDVSDLQNGMFIVSIGGGIRQNQLIYLP